MGAAKPPKLAPRSSAFQDLALFSVPASFRGRSAFFVQIWWLVQALIFRPLPQICFPLRRLILRAFGAHVGANVKIRPGVRITYPWKVSIGDNTWIGDDVTLYSLGPIAIGSNSVISQQTYICAADHDHSDVTFPLRERPVCIGSEVWIAGAVWIGPGVTIGDGTVVGARSNVFKSLPPRMICFGSPCVPVKVRAPSSRRADG